MPKIFKDKNDNVLYTGYETSEVVANPTLAGTEASLTGVQIGSTKYKVPEGFSGNYNDLTNKPDLSIYELAANAFSGNYNDLTNKPTIPAAVSGTNDGTNWTGLTIGNDTYTIPQGGGASSHLYEVYFDVYYMPAGCGESTTVKFSTLVGDISGLEAIVEYPEELYSYSGARFGFSSAAYAENYISALYGWLWQLFKGNNSSSDPAYYLTTAFVKCHGGDTYGSYDIEGKDYFLAQNVRVCNPVGGYRLQLNPVDENEGVTVDFDLSDQRWESDPTYIMVKVRQIN